MPLFEKEARAICDKLLSYIKADDAEVSVSSEDYSYLRFAANSITTSGRREDLSVGVTVWINQKKGSASTNEVDDTSLRAAVSQAQQLASLSPVDREYLPTLGPQQYKASHGYVEATAAISPVMRARAVGEVIAACEREKVVGAGFHQARGSSDAAATKHGNFRYSRESLASLSVTARTREGGGSGYFLRNHFDVAKLDTSRIAREAVQKSLRSREPRTLSPGTYTVVLEPQAVADLLGFFAFLFDARSADEGRSPYSASGGKTKLGQKIFDGRINLYTDPWHPELPGSPAAQGGLPAEKFPLVRNGRLENLVYTRYWAKEKNKPATPGPANSIMESSEPSVRMDDIIKNTDRGLLVSRFWYVRMVDPRTALLTGLTRDGVWHIEEGQIEYPVRNFRFNQSLLQLLAPGNVDLIGAPERVGPSEAQGGNPVLLPALKVKEFHFTSQSEAV
jgi:predicted Zn-dependent protease